MEAKRPPDVISVWKRRVWGPFYLIQSSATLRTRPRATRKIWWIYVF